MQYNMSVLSTSGLDPTREHVVKILSVPRGGPSGASTASLLIMFDYATYT